MQKSGPQWQGLQHVLVQALVQFWLAAFESIVGWCPSKWARSGEDRGQG